MTQTHTAASVAVDAGDLADQVLARRAAGDRFAGLYATATGAHRLRLTALIATRGGVQPLDAIVPADRYPALTPRLPAAFWYERIIHDLFGIVADGHRRLDPLILPLGPGAARPCPGQPLRPAAIDPDGHVIGRLVVGTGLFTIPHGPVRSGVTESVEYLVETAGEDIPHLRLRPFHKHRGVDVRFEGQTSAGGVLVAERVEGVATVAHALAYAHAVETLAGITPPPANLAAAHGALGPVGRASGVHDDDRVCRGHDACPTLDPTVADGGDTGDALDVADGHITRCAPRSASLHNLALYATVFAGDILTDFPFIEASFGLSTAGVAL